MSDAAPPRDTSSRAALDALAPKRAALLPDDPLSGSTAVRVQALAAPSAFAVLAAVLAGVGAVPAVEAAWAAAAALLGFAGTGWLDPSGWRRRGAEALLILPAFALTLVADPTMRRMLVPPLLLAALLAAALAALRRCGDRERGIVLPGLAIAVRSATGLGLVGVGFLPLALAGAVTVVVGRAAARWRSTELAVAAVLLAGTLPFERYPLLALTAALAAGATTILGASLPRAGRLGRAWFPGLLAAALVAAAAAPWGGIGLSQAFPRAGWLAVAATAVAAAVAPLLPPAGAGAMWVLATLAFGPLHPPPPDRAQVELTAANPAVTLPPGTGGLYLAEVNLANSAALRQGTVVAFIEVGGGRLPVRAGVEAAEWAHERPDVVATVIHSLPERPVWRPTGIGGGAVWAVSGQMSGVVQPGVAPVVRRQPSLPSAVTVSVATAGPSAPTPPRDWPLPAWLLAAAAAVALLQGVAGTWRQPGAWLPWSVLALGSLISRMPVEPLRLLGERHAVDLAMAALLAAWLPLARVWMARRWVAATALALLVPLAAATPHLTPPVGDEAYHLLLLKSLREDLDLDLANNYDVVKHPENRIFITPKGWFLHSPVLAMLLLPGYFLAGRAGAAALLAAAAALATALLARRARALGVPESRVAVMVGLVLLGYPLATFATQVWAEVPGVFLVSIALTLATASPPRPLLASAAAVLSAWIKTRLVLVTLPLAVAAWLPRKLALRSSRNLILAAVLTATAAIALSIFWFGSALDTIPGRRQASHLLPRNVRQTVTTIGGLALDAAGGLAFSAPLALVALAGVPLLWRRGAPADRALILAGLLTLLSQLSNREWRGGDSPPARYLVVLLPMAALAGALLLQTARRWRSAVVLLIAPTLIVWWVFLTRPHLGFNIGDGGFWLSDALARRFEVSARHLFPSFLRPSPSTLAWPMLAAAAFAGVALLARRSVTAMRALARVSVAALLLAGAALVATLTLRYDRIVELEDPQVVRYGGTLHPPAGQMSRFAFRNGWRLGPREAIEVPLHVPGNADLVVQGWLEGAATGGAAIALQWRDGALTHVPVSGKGDFAARVPAPPSTGRHRLVITGLMPPGGSAVLDNIVVSH